MTQVRIDHLLMEIEQFNTKLLQRTQQSEQLQLEIRELENGMLTRHGGIIELRKLIEENEMVVNKNDEHNPS